MCGPIFSGPNGVDLFFLKNVFLGFLIKAQVDVFPAIKILRQIKILKIILQSMCGDIIPEYILRRIYYITRTSYLSLK